MTFRQYAIIMSLATLLCWVAWGFVLFTVDPNFATRGSFVFFYVTLFAALFGTASILFCTLFYFFSRAALPMYRYVEKSFRLATLISLLVVALLALKAAGLLSLLTAALLAALLSFALLFISKRKNHQATFFSEPS